MQDILLIYTTFVLFIFPLLLLRCLIKKKTNDKKNETANEIIIG